MSIKRMKLSKFADLQGIEYGTAYKYWQKGRIEGIQLDSGTILVSDWKIDTSRKAIIYTRVYDPKQRQELDDQLKRLRDYVEEKEYELVDEIEEVGYGFAANRTKFLEILQRSDWGILIVENKEIPLKFGFDYLQAALNLSGRRIEYRTNLSTPSETILAALLHNTEQIVSRLLGVGHKRQVLDAIKRIHT